MRLIYMGSPESAVHPLCFLLQNTHSQDSGPKLVAVVSQPAALKGRGRKKQPEDPPVAEFAKTQGIPVLQPARAKDADFLASVRELKPDVIVTCAYGQILTQEFLSIPTRGTVNIHPSLLPAYRGATPVPAALLAGDSSTAVTVLFTVRALDAGNIILQKPFAIGAEETAGELTDRLFKESGPLLLDALDLLRDSEFSGIPQNPDKVSLCGKISKDMGEIDWNQTSDVICNRFRAFHPWPGSWFEVAGLRTSVTAMTLRGEVSGQGAVCGDFRLSADGQALAVKTADSWVFLRKLKPSGGKEMDARAFWNGYLKKMQKDSGI